MDNGKRKAVKGETPSPQMSKLLKLSDSDTGPDSVTDTASEDTATEENVNQCFDLNDKSDRQILKLLCTQMRGVMAELKTVNKQQNKIIKHINKLEQKVAGHDKEIKHIKKKQNVVTEKLENILSDIEPPLQPRSNLSRPIHPILCQ